MQIDIVNSDNQKIGSVDLSDAVFGGLVKTDLIWESVVRASAAERRGTQMAKNRALVSGSGKKPWRQKGTGRARVGSVRNPLWRHGGVVFPPQPRSYEYQLPKKVERGALRAALAEKLAHGEVVVVEALESKAMKTKAAAEMLRKLGIAGKAVLVDIKPDAMMARSVRNIPGVNLVASSKLTARDVAEAEKVVTTKSALEKLQEALG